MCSSHLQQPRTCAVCNGQLSGRSDKIYCDLKCKNKYHGQKRSEFRRVYAVYSKIAYNNAEILASLLQEVNDRLVISELELSRLGFNFNHVSSWKFKQGAMRYQIFNFSWYFGKHGKVIISKNPEMTDISPFIFKRWKFRYPQDQLTSAAIRPAH